MIRVFVYAVRKIDVSKRGWKNTLVIDVDDSKLLPFWVKKRERESWLLYSMNVVNVRVLLNRVVCIPTRHGCCFCKLGNVRIVTGHFGFNAKTLRGQILNKLLDTYARCKTIDVLREKNLSMAKEALRPNKE